MHGLQNFMMVNLHAICIYLKGNECYLLFPKMRVHVGTPVIMKHPVSESKQLSCGSDLKVN